ncbi:carbohydrate-binding family 9-like protein [Verrucomicrobiota bacterium]
MNKMQIILSIMLAVAVSTGFSRTPIGARESKHPAAQTKYECRKTDEIITIDGRLDEDAWRRAPAMPFVGITDGSKPPFITEAKMLWDDKYLYAAYYFEEPDLRAYWAMDEVNSPEELIETVSRKVRSRPPKDLVYGTWDYTECAIMMVDRFAKLFLDPDGDGINYLEFQCNPLNIYFDSWYKQGYVSGSGENYNERNRFPSVEWRCRGFLSATRMDGTVNAPHDVDRGWSIELAIPWTSLAPLTKGSCPPASGDIWGAHLGRVYRDRVGGENEYWVWPFLAVKQCHLPDRYGKLIFKDDLRHFERFFAWGVPKEDEPYIKRVVELGVTDLITGMPSSNAVALYAASGINVFPVVTPRVKGWKKKYPDTPPAIQKMTDAEFAANDLVKGVKSSHRSSAGQEGDADEPSDWNMTDKEKKAIDRMSRANYRIQSRYQWGGEIDRDHFGKTIKTEVLHYDILCFNTPSVKELVRDRIKDALAIPGVKGLAFDAIGYQNYYACFCPVCEKLFNENCEKEKKDPKKEENRNEFSLKCLVDFNNEMVDYARSLKADAVTINHIWPVYMPEPLYGNRLKIDFCGQTAAWFMYWDPWRIEKYSRIITSEQEKYWKGVKGVPFIGYYDNPNFPVKTPAKVESELRAILRGGSTLMMHGLDDLMKNEDIYAVFKKFCASPAAASKTAGKKSRKKR